MAKTVVYDICGHGTLNVSDNATYEGIALAIVNASDCEIDIVTTEDEPEAEAEWVAIETHTTCIPVYWNAKEANADTKGPGIETNARCSNCGYMAKFIGYKKTGLTRIHNFCPKCGKKMKKEVKHDTM